MTFVPSDFRFATRALLRTPLLFGTAVLTLAAGTGLATAVFALAYGVLLRPLPYPDPSRLVAIQLTHSNSDRSTGVGLREVDEWMKRLRAIDHVSGHATNDFSLRGAGEPRSVRATMITTGLFDTLGVRPLQGSTADVAGSNAAVVLGARLVDQIGRDTGWRDRGVTLGTRDFHVSAVMPPSFTFPTDKTDVWVPAEAVPDLTFFSSSDQRRFNLVGRLAPGATLQQAQDDARRVVREIDRDRPAGERREANVRPLDQVVRENAGPMVIPFVVGAALVLLIGCANVSGLLVGRAVARQREFAVRRALGGGVGQVLRACLAESLVVSLCGWLIGIGGARLIVLAFTANAAAAIPNLQAVRFDGVALMVSFALAVLVGLVSGGVPALRALRSDPNLVLKQSSERIGAGGTAFRGALVVLQIGLTVVLLVCAGLLMRTVARVVSEERGFDARHSLALRLMLAQTVRFQVTERLPFVEALVTRSRALPGVVAAGIGSVLPPNGSQITLSIRIVTEDRNETLGFSYAAATPGYLEAIGAALVKGRFFEEHDRLASPPTIVVTESAARAMFRERDPVGRDWPAPLPGPGEKRVRPRVIGVVRDIKYGGLDRPAPSTIFAIWERLAPSNAHLVLRTAGRPEEVAAAVRRLVQDLDSAIPLFTPQTLDEVVSGSIADRRLRLQIAATFAVLALGLAAVALWGAVAQNVLDRRHELAVRLALGSTSAGAVGLLLRRGVLLTAGGVSLGVTVSVVAARTLRHLLHGVGPLDPPSFLSGIAVAAVVSIVASYLPARRAAAISPSELLRQA